MVIFFQLAVILLPVVYAENECTAVPLEKCGTTSANNCLECASSTECRECCPSCFPTGKPGHQWCECRTGPDTWEQYSVAGMNVLSVTGGEDKAEYDKAVIMLHGGGGSGTDWIYNYDQGWFGNMKGLKYVWPTSVLQGNVWYFSFKNDCGLEQDCAYNITSIQESALNVAELVEHEAKLLGGDLSKVYLAGFSQGGQLSAYMQIANLKAALGGVIVMSAFPLPPLCDMPGGDPVEAKKNATYYGDDMRWMIWLGESDFIFPVQFTNSYYKGIFDVLDIEDTLKVNVSQPRQGHDLTQPEFDAMVKFIRE